MFVDTHCHLNIIVKKEFDVPLGNEHFPLIANLLKESADAGVSKIVNVGTSLQESINSIEIAKRFKNVFATAGIHPCDCSDVWQQDLKALSNFVQHKEENKIVAIGEVGLDFYHKPYDKQRQYDAFKAQIELALKHDLPLVIHVRDAGDELLKIVGEYVKEIKGAVIHCFSQKQDFADVVTRWGFYIGIDAPITYPKNGELRAIVKQVPLEHIILETDAPFLPPQQYRGKQNVPAYLPIFAALIAEIKGVSVDQLASITTKNAEKLFGV